MSDARGGKHLKICILGFLKRTGSSLHVQITGTLKSSEDNHSDNLRCAWGSDPSISSNTKQIRLRSPRRRDATLTELRLEFLSASTSAYDLID